MPKLRASGGGVWVVLVAALALSSCRGVDVQQNAAIDQSDKTISVPPGSSYVLGPLKRELARQGWKTMVYGGGPLVSEGTVGDRTRIETYNTFNTRYRLLVRQQPFDTCFDGGALLAFDMAIIDNKTGAEAVTLSGRACESSIVDKFKTAIGG